MEIQGYNISMIRGDTETIKILCKDAQGVDVPLEDGDTLYFTVKTSVGTEKKERADIDYLSIMTGVEM